MDTVTLTEPLTKRKCYMLYFSLLGDHVVCVLELISILAKVLSSITSNHMVADNHYSKN